MKKPVPNVSGSWAIIDRRTNQVVESVPCPDEENPYILPPPSTVVWHYLRFEYFESLLANGSIHFSRLDKQSDKSDGMYSEANAHEFTPTMGALMRKMNIHSPPKWDDLQTTNEILRKKTFVHCWSIRAQDAALMWEKFLPGNTRSVAIRSTLLHLQRALIGQPVRFRQVPYYGRNKPRPDYSYSAPFSAKDRSFADERELRLLVMNEIGDSEIQEHRLIPVSTRTMVLKVVVHPASEPEFRDEARALLRKHQIPASVAKSRLTASDLTAMRARLNEERN